ncbi:MAG TPA: DUF3987 domain-containing protein [Candidatus Ozemobacteraceae bacterium]
MNASECRVSVFSSGTSKKPIRTAMVREVVDHIKSDRLKASIERLRGHLAAGNKQAYDVGKLELIGVSWAGTFSYLDKKSLIERSGLVVIDFDHLGEKLFAVRAALEADPAVAVCFTSPSGDGIKAVYAIDSEADHSRAWRAAADRAKRTTGIESDEKNKDVSRLCFLSYDHSCYFNPDPVPVEIHVEQEPSKIEMPKQPVSSNERYARAALEKAVAVVVRSVDGSRNQTLNDEAYSLGQLIGGGVLIESEVAETLRRAAIGAGLPDSEAEKTIESGVNAGKMKPRTVPEGNSKNSINSSSNILEWGEPVPLCSRMAPEPYPLDALPLSIRAAIEEVRGWVKAPVSMVAGAALGALSVALQGHVDVKRAEGLDGPTSLFLLTFGDSGERKSTCDKAFMKPIWEYEAKQAEKAKPKIDAYRAEVAIWEAKRNAALEAVKKSQIPGKATADAEKCVRDLESNKPVKPKVPKLIYGDATQEGLAYDLASIWPSAGMISAEAGLVFGSHGMNKENIMRYLSSFNIFWDGGAIPITRRKEGASYTVEGIRLTMSLQVQEATIREFLEKSGTLARGSGFLARFLLAWPESTQGERLFTEPPAHLPQISAFHARVLELLDADLPMDDEGRLEPKTLTLSQDAKALWVKFHDAVEVQLASGGRLYDVRDVASKIADNAVRLAALFHTFERGPSGAISVDTLEGAVKIASWHLNESRRFFGEIAMPEEVSTASRLERWILKNCRAEETDRVTTNRVQQFGPGDLRRREKIETAVKELQERGRAQLVRDGHRKYIVVNPAILKGGLEV